MRAKIKRPVGRPKIDTAPLAVRLPRETLDAIDRYRENTKRTDAVRAILRDWLIGHGYLPPEDNS